MRDEAHPLARSPVRAHGM